MGKTTKMNVADASKMYMQLFGANKNLYRAIPSVIDGCKPVTRRFLYVAYKTSARTTLTKVKVLASSTMRFHPHGDTSVEGVITSLGQPWRNNVLLIDTKGSFGNARGAAPSAPRYIDAKLSKFAMKCFFDDFEKSEVDMKLSYQGEPEPEYLPAKYPVILFNPQFSDIGYALAANIPSFNVTEVCQAVIDLITKKNPKIFLIPDIPSGCDIVDTGTFDEINKKGTGTLTCRSTYTIDQKKNVITITSLPLQVTLDQVINQILKLRDEKNLDELVEIQDCSEGKSGVSFKLFLKPDVDPEKFIKKLFKKNTRLQLTYSVGIKVIDDYQALDFGVKGLLEYWIDYRRECLRAMYNREYRMIMERLHMIEIMLELFNKDNAEKTLGIIKKSKTTSESIEKLVKEYKITSLQAKTINGMKFNQFNEEARTKQREEKDQLEKRLIVVQDVLRNNGKVDEIIVEQMKECIKLFGGPRKSRVIPNDDERVIPNTNHLIGISKDGYIKKLSLKDEMYIGNVGYSKHIQALSINNRNSVLVIDSNGRMCNVKISNIPDSKLPDVGFPIGRYSAVTGNIVSIIEVPQEMIEADDEKESNLVFVFVTKKGYAKKTSINEFYKIRDFKLCLNLDEDDEMISAFLTKETSKNQVIIYTNKGRGIRLNMSEIKTFKRTSKGSRQLNLSDDEYVAGCDEVDSSEKYLVYITSSGKLKLTELKYFPEMKRRDECINLIQLDSRETLIGVSSVSKSDTVVIYRKKTEPVEIPVSDITVSSRVAKATKLIKTPNGDSVIDYSITRKKK